MSSLGDRIVSVISVGMLAVSGVVLLSGNSPIVARAKEVLASRRIKQQVVSMWPSLVSQPARIDSAGTAVRIVEVSDYECPYCRKAHPEVTRFLQSHPSTGIVYLNLPLPIHAAANGAARAAICAGNQGRFRQMHARLFETAAWQTDQNWEREARAVGIESIPDFKQCLSADATTRRLANEEALAAKLDITGTPSFVYKGGVVVGAQTSDDLVRMSSLP